MDYGASVLLYVGFFLDLFAASVDHLMTLIVGIGPVVYSLNNPDPQIQSLLFCKLRGYIFQICLMLSRWFIAFACVDRYALTSDKINLRNFAKPKLAYRIIVIIIIFWSIICSHRLIFYEIRGKFCGIINNMAAALYHSLYVIIGGGICPAMIMIICAWFIRRNLAHKHKKRTQLSLGESQRNTLDQQVLRILFAQIICYIIFTIPQLCNLVFNTISITIPNRSNEHLAIEVFVAFLAELMLYLFPVTSFYLYTLTSRTFRKELIKFFSSMLSRKGRITPAIGGTTATFHVDH
ncbi:unnamed protein product [Rotaria sp. Silwood1]|nr:unnamed protein product [Rotaria sp. Silwood1]CAF3398411.1 unnamed protein product [Rotaria sp. Silwood1]CAF3412930.1 unnamed protein product [Rotaria sp. Silwood1]CAF3416806.1 unnamed protein product [Rotaria sp. Silwood1]CAF4559747.1 unnamed protein product [Rotaria sp. Silwood1]